MSSVFQSTKDRIEEFLISRRIEFGEEQIGDDYFRINFLIGGKFIGSISYVTTTETSIMLGYVTRRSTTVETETGSIQWLGVDPSFRGKGYATAFMMLAICEIMIKNPSIRYIVLDDDSDRGSETTNIYAKFGFVHTERIDPGSSVKRFSPSGPEKQMMVDKNFVKNMIPAILREIVNNPLIGMVGGRKIRIRKTKTRKTKTRKTKTRKTKTRKTKRK